MNMMEAMMTASQYRRLELLAAWRFFVQYRTIGGFNHLSRA